MRINSEDLIITDHSDKRNKIDRVETLTSYLSHCWKIGHEIANPLTGIIGITELLIAEKKSLTKSQMESLKQILICAEQIELILERLSDSKLNLAENVQMFSDLQSLIETRDLITIND